MTELTSSNFDENTRDGVVLVDFWADWCGPCKMMGPILNQVSAKFDGDDNVNVFKVNADTEPELAKRFGITSIPALVFIKEAETIKTVTGVQPEAIVTQALEDLKEM